MGGLRGVRDGVYGKVGVRYKQKNQDLDSSKPTQGICTERKKGGKAETKGEEKWSRRGGRSSEMRRAVAAIRRER